MSDGIVRALAHRQSPLHRLDPRVRVLCVLGAGVWAAFTAHLAALAGACIFALVLNFLARIPLLLLLRRMVLFNGFMLLVVLSLPFSTVGEPLWRLGNLMASREGFEQAMRIVLTGNHLTLLITALIATLEPQVLAHALLHLKVPRKLVRILMFAIRYVDVLNDSRRRVMRAMQARGYAPRCNPRGVRGAAALVTGLMAESLERAQRVERAMRCRGWRGEFPVLDHFHAALGDFGFALLFAAVLILIRVSA